MKKVNSFLPLHPVSFYRQDYEKQNPGTLPVLSCFKLQNMLTKISFLVWLFESGNCGEKKEKSRQSIEFFKNKKNFLEEIKTIFHNVWNTFFWKAQALNLNTQNHINVDLV